MCIKMLSRNLLFAWMLVLCTSCSKDVTSQYQQFDVHVSDKGYQLFVDHFYQFGATNRLSLLWFGWYQTDNPSEWYESNEPSNFKIKAELLSEENGLIFASNGFEEGIVRIAIHCGDRKEEWITIVENYVSDLRENESFNLSGSKIISCEPDNT